MRVGYGYERAESLFKDLGCEEVLIDTEKTHRTERASLFKLGRLRKYDTLVVLALGDFGRGFGLAKFRRLLDDLGVTIEVCPPEKIAGIRGRPATFTPDITQDDQIRTLWNSVPHTLAYVLKRAGEIMGHDVKRHQLSHRYGRRNGKR